MSIRLTGTALITGAGLGIGRATALAYARAGVSALSISDINNAHVQSVAAEARRAATNPRFEVLAQRTDVTDEAAVRDMVAASVAAFGRIDYACNNAGRPVHVNTTAAEMTKENWDATNNVNVYGLLYTQREELRAMLRQQPVAADVDSGGGGGARPPVRGAIVNLASVSGFFASPRSMAYVAGKHAVVGMTRSAALDHAADGIRVNCVCPGAVRTELLMGMIGDKTVAEKEALYEAQAMQGRMGAPEEIADVVVFLGSPMAGFVTGASWEVDGGFSAF